MTSHSARRHLAFHYERTLGFIADELVKNDFRPVHISQRWASFRLEMSPRSWRRDCKWLAENGYIYRLCRRGRGRGSLYALNTRTVSLALNPNTKSEHLNGHRKLKNGHLSPAGQYANRTWKREIGSDLGIGKRARMDPNLPKGRDDRGADTGARGEEVGGTAATTAPDVIPTPNPSPTQGGERHGSIPVQLSSGETFYISREEVGTPRPPSPFEEAQDAMEELLGKTEAHRRQQYLAAVAAKGES